MHVNHFSDFFKQCNSREGGEGREEEEKKAAIESGKEAKRQGAK